MQTITLYKIFFFKDSSVTCLRYSFNSSETHINFSLWLDIIFVCVGSSLFVCPHSFWILWIPCTGQNNGCTSLCASLNHFCIDLLAPPLSDLNYYGPSLQILIVLFFYCDVHYLYSSACNFHHQKKKLFSLLSWVSNYCVYFLHPYFFHGSYPFHCGNCLCHWTHLCDDILIYHLSCVIPSTSGDFFLICSQYHSFPLAASFSFSFHVIFFSFLVFSWNLYQILYFSFAFSFFWL